MNNEYLYPVNFFILVLNTYKSVYFKTNAWVKIIIFSNFLKTNNFISKLFSNCRHKITTSYYFVFYLPDD